MTANEFETGVNNLLDNTPPKGVNGSLGITKAILKQIVAIFKQFLSDVNTAYANSLNYRGAWSSVTAYAVKDVVISGGSTYRCKLANTNKAPATNADNWDLLAGKGDPGLSAPNATLNVIPKLAAAGNFADTAISEETYDYGVIQRNTASLRYYRNEIIFSGNITTILNASKAVAYIDFGVVTAFTGVLTVEIHGTYNNYLAMDKIVVEFSLYMSGGAISYILKKVLSATGYIGNGTAIGTLTVSGGRLVLPIYGNSNGNPLAVKVIGNTFNITPASGVVTMFKSITLIDWVADTTPFIRNRERIVQEVVFTPAGTSVVFDLRRPYPFSWAVVYNDSVTIVSQPSANVDANTSAPLTLTGTAGKTLTISITPNT